MAVRHVFSSAGGWSYGRKPYAEKPEDRYKLGLTYFEDEITTRVMDDIPASVVLGKTKVGGSMISQYTNPGSTTLTNTLIHISQGPIESISSIRLNGNAIADYGASTATKMGYHTQTTIAGFGKSTSLTAYNLQSSWGNPVEILGATQFDSFLAKITYIDGIYEKKHGQDTLYDAYTHYGWFWRYRVSGGGAYTLGGSFSGTMLSTSPVDIYISGTMPSLAIWDLELEPWGWNVNAGPGSRGTHADPYVKSLQIEGAYGLTYPNQALIAATSIPTTVLSTENSFTAIAEGHHFQEIASGTTVSTAAHTRNPADIAIGMIYNRLWGGSRYIDRRVKVTITGATGDFTVGEIVHGPGTATTDYIFKGTVQSVSGTTVVLLSTQGLPHGLLTGQTSAKTATVTAIVKAYAADLPSFWEMKQFNNEWVPDGTVGTTVDANTASGQKVLNVAATTAFTAADRVVINYGGDREESAVIDTIQAGVSITLLTNLTYAHTAAQADTVSVAEVRHYFDYEAQGEDNVWDVLQKIGKTSRTIFFLRGGQVIAKRLKSETPTGIFNEANIIPKSLKVTFFPVGDRPNRFRAWFRDEDHEYKKRFAPVKDVAADAASERLMVTSEDFFGISRASQASREGFFNLQRARYIKKHIEFKASLSGLKVDVGKVFYFQHDLPGYGQGGGRVLSSTNSTVTFTHDVTLGAGSYSIRVLHADDTEETQTVTTSAGTYRTISIAAATWTTNPVRGSLFAIGTLAQYRCMAKGVDMDLIATIQAEEDSASMYSDIYAGTLPTFTETTLPNPDEMPDDVTSLTLTEVNEVVGGKANNEIDASWQEPDHNASHDAMVWHRKTLGASDTFGVKKEEGETLDNTMLWCPGGVCTDGTYIYVSDTLNHRIFKLDYIDWTYDSKIGSLGTGDDQFSSPMGMCTNGTHLFIADTGNNRIQKRLCSDLSYVAKIGTKGSGNDQFYFPYDIAMNTTHVFVADTYNHRIHKRDHALTYVSKIGSSGTGNDQFDTPCGIDVNVAEDFLFVADTRNYRVQKRTTADALVYSTKVGSQGYGASTFCGPTGVSVDAADAYVYVTDFGPPSGADFTLYSRVMIRDHGDLSAETILPGSASAWGGAVGSGPDQLNQPYDICVDRVNSLYYFIADRWNNRIVRRTISTSANNDWTYDGRSAKSSIRIKGAFEPGDHIQVAVASSSITNQHKDPDDAPEETIVIAGAGSVPHDVEALVAKTLSIGKARLSWYKPADISTKFWEIRKGTEWQTGTVVVTELNQLWYDVPIEAGLNTVYWIKAMNSVLTYSANATSATIYGGIVPLLGGGLSSGVNLSV